MDNVETHAMLYTLHRTKTNKENITQKAKKVEKHGHHQQAWMNSSARKG